MMNRNFWFSSISIDLLYHLINRGFIEVYHTFWKIIWQMWVLSMINFSDMCPLFLLIGFSHTCTCSMCSPKLDCQDLCLSDGRWNWPSAPKQLTIFHERWQKFGFISHVWSFSYLCHPFVHPVNCSCKSRSLSYDGKLRY